MKIRSSNPEELDLKFKFYIKTDRNIFKSYRLPEKLSKSEKQIILVGRSLASKYWSSLFERGPDLKTSFEKAYMPIQSELAKAAFIMELSRIISDYASMTPEDKTLPYSHEDLGEFIGSLTDKLQHLPREVSIPTIRSRDNRTSVFVSYSHLDKAFLYDVQRHFKPFFKGIDYWDDSRIQPGEKWKEEIREAIDNTKVAILLVSTNFFGSEFIETEELPPLLEAAEKDGAVVLTVIIKPCLFEKFPKLNQYQAMNPPSNPVSKMDKNEREEFFVNLVRQTLKVLESKVANNE